MYWPYLAIHETSIALMPFGRRMGNKEDEDSKFGAIEKNEEMVEKMEKFGILRSDF